MLHIHCTKKLFAKLPVDEDGRLPVVGNEGGNESGNEMSNDTQTKNVGRVLTRQDVGLKANPQNASYNPLSGWHANLITLQRRNCIILVHDATRFGIFIPCVTKPDYAGLQWDFEDVFMNTLLKGGHDGKNAASHEHLETAAQLLQELTFDTDCNRSVQGTMNRMVGDLEHMLNYDNAKVENLSPYKVGAWLSERPCKVKGQKDYLWPNQAMLALLENKTNLPDNVISMVDFKRQQNNKNEPSDES